MKITETYTTLKARQREELNNFEGIFFAFNNQQFDDGMRKVGLEPDQTNLIYKLPGGGFILKTRSKAFGDMFDRHEAERKQARKDEKHLLESLVYELGNHEYCITFNESDALDALGLERKDVPDRIMKKAKKIYWASIEEHQTA